MKRYRVLAPAVVMQVCLGTTDAWSVFVLPLKQITTILQGTALLPFSMIYFAIPATMIVTGSLLPKIGPRQCAVIGGVSFDRMGNFSPFLWGIGGLMACGAIARGRGGPLRNHNKSKCYSLPWPSQLILVKSVSM